MSGAGYRRNHYVPQWYQHRFFRSSTRERKFYYLDLKPKAFVDAQGARRIKTALRRWGPTRCFEQTDLYTTKFGSWESTEIEEKFFGRIDDEGRRSLDYFEHFKHPSSNDRAHKSIMSYMSVQKLRTPKGLAYLSALADASDRNIVLLAMQRLQNLYAAVWTESVWSIANASQSETKFILSDHPVTVYNRECFPGSNWCRGFADPDIWLGGTHTLFPLSCEKILILTNLSWVRNPHGGATKLRPNPNPWRPVIFDFRQIQTERHLSDIEVNEINYIIKRRAHRYIAAPKHDWLHPEAHIPTTHWNKLGKGYLLMPDPRSMLFSREIVIRYRDKRTDRFDEYGRRPWQRGFNDEAAADREWRTFHAFQGEFARIFGPKRRGRAYSTDRLDDAEDDPDYHAYHLTLEREYKRSRNRDRRS